MRKPRDFDAELKALSDKAGSLKERKLRQLGELVLATGADRLPLDLLTGALLAAAGQQDGATREVWGKSGAAFFHQRTRRAPRRSARDSIGQSASHGITQSTVGEPGS